MHTAPSGGTKESANTVGVAIEKKGSSHSTRINDYCISRLYVYCYEIFHQPEIGNPMN